jgi:hypothetical protein
MPRAVLLALLLGTALVLAGCAAKTDEGATPASTDANESTANVHANATVTAGNASASAGNNGTTNQTGARDPRMPEDPSNCMGGMDMPGCTAAQYEYYYAKTMANTPQPPPDKALPPIKIGLTPQGPDGTGKASLDAGTMELLVTVHLNDTGPGPYAALGPDGTSDLKVTLKGPTASKVITLAGSSHSVGVDPASPLASRFTGSVTMPAAGDWTVTLDGIGQNAQVTINLVERFSM